MSGPIITMYTWLYGPHPQQSFIGLRPGAWFTTREKAEADFRDGMRSGKIDWPTTGYIVEAQVRVLGEIYHRPAEEDV